MIPRRPQSKARTRTIRDVAAHRRRTLESERLMMDLHAGKSCGAMLRDVTMLDVLIHCARWLGGADVTIATWAVSVGAIEHLATTKPVRSVVWYLDRSQNARKPKVVAAAKACGTVHIIDSHAKVTVLQGAGNAIVLAGSANLTKSRGAEFLSLDVDQAYASAVLVMLQELAG